MSAAVDEITAEQLVRDPYEVYRRLCDAGPCVWLAPAARHVVPHSDDIYALDENRAFTAAEPDSLWMSPIAMYPRYVSSDTRLGDVELAAGSRVGVMLASANRDERHWEKPDRFDLRRATQRHVAFSRGPNVCLGAFVARLQVGRAALPRLFERLPGLRLATGCEPQQVGWVFRGLASLEVTWGR
jgi:Cytochrome P450